MLKFKVPKCKNKIYSRKANMLERNKEARNKQKREMMLYNIYNVKIIVLFMIP